MIDTLSLANNLYQENTPWPLTGEFIIPIIAVVLVGGIPNTGALDGQIRGGVMGKIEKIVAEHNSSQANITSTAP